MADGTAIEWTDASWNPVRARDPKTLKVGWHCEHATAGCEFCYAEGINKRLGTGLPFKPGHRKDLQIFIDEATLLQPLHWKRPRKIFVGSMTDLFADFVTDDMLDRIFAVMALCPQHTFQMLTKRAERMRGYVSDWHASQIGRGDCCTRIAAECAKHGSVPFAETVTPAKIRHRWPLPNVWLGVSAERQEEADERIPHLLATPAAVRFVSAEPLLGPINFLDIRHGAERWDVLRGNRVPMTAGEFDARFFAPSSLDWIIVGGESGSRARPMQTEWAEAIRDQCRAAGVSFFMKQMTKKAPIPEHLMIRQFPEDRR